MLKFCQDVALILSLVVFSTIRAECNSPPAIDNAETSSSNSQSFPQGSFIRYECNAGFNPVGSSPIFRCNGTDWIGGPFKCEQVFCPNVETPENGKIINEPSFVVGDTISFACNQGYDMHGTNLLICQTDAQWSPTQPPTCTAKDCGEFGSIQYGSTFQDLAENERNHYGRVVRVTCDEGYIIHGSPEVKCEANGHWGVKPSCEPITCPPYPNLNSSCIQNLFVYDNIIFITCKEDVSVTHTGGNSAECTESGWHPLDVACFCDCHIMLYSNSSVIVHDLNDQSYLPHGASLQWSCTDGLTKSHFNYVVCENGVLKAKVDGEDVAIINDSNFSQLCLKPTTQQQTTTTISSATVTPTTQYSAVTDAMNYSKTITGSDIVHTVTKSDVISKTFTAKKIQSEKASQNSSANNKGNITVFICGIYAVIFSVYIAN